MIGIDCLDTYNNPIEYFTQWDVDQKIKIVLHDCKEGLLAIAPNVHFCNIKSKEALVVRSTVENGDTVVVDVPNLLLTEPYSIIAYVYLTDSIDVSSQKTIVKVDIPMRKRQKPSDYEYVENIERITAQTIKQEISEEFAQEIGDGNLSVTGFTIIDASTGKGHKIYASDNKFLMDVVSSDDSKQTYSVLDTRDKDEIESNVNSVNQNLTSSINSTKQELSDSISSTKQELTNSIEDTKQSLNSLIDQNKTSIGELEKNKVNYSDIVNNTDTNDASKPLSAAMGIELKNFASTTSENTANNKVSEHNVSNEAHNDIRILISELETRLNTVADSDDETLDQLSEVVAYIKSNRELIDAITTSKVSVSDIIDNLITNDSAKPLSAAMGVELKSLFDSLPSWSKEPQKPSYTASEVGAEAEGAADEKISAHDSSDTAHSDIRTLVQSASDLAQKALDTAVAGGGSAAEGIDAHNVSPTAHEDMRTLISEVESTANSANESANSALEKANEALDKANAAEVAGVAESKVAEHNSDNSSHSDIRQLVSNAQSSADAAKDAADAAKSSADEALRQIEEGVASKLSAGNGIEIVEDKINLKIATSSSIGGIKPGSGCTVTSDGTLNVVGGGGTSNIPPTVNAPNAEGYANGALLSEEGGLTLGMATSSNPGIMSSNDKNKLDSLENYILPPATSTSLGGVKAGNGVSISEDGTISAGGSASLEFLEDDEFIGIIDASVQE